MDHELTSQGLPSNDKGDHEGRIFLSHPYRNNGFFLLNIKYLVFFSKGWYGVCVIELSHMGKNRGNSESGVQIIEPRHEISNNMVCATSKGSDMSLIRAFASHIHIL